MDLYRAVLAVNAIRVVVLEWDGATEIRHESLVEQIQAIRIDTDLLSATFSMFLIDGRTVTLGYSSVSDKEIGQVVSFLRERMSSGAEIHRKPLANISDRPEIDVGDGFYLSMWWKHVRRSSTAGILYWEQPGIRLSRLKSSLGCLFVDTGRELLIIHRGQFVRRWFEAIYAGAELHIPWSTIQSVELVELPAGRKSAVTMVKISVQGHAINVELFASNKNQEQLIAEMATKIKH